MLIEALHFEADDQEGTGLEDEELANDPVMQIDLTVSSWNQQRNPVIVSHFVPPEKYGVIFARMRLSQRQQLQRSR
jgi:hypothetical protein